MREIRKINIIGAGNVATHLAIALKNAGIEIPFIYSRNQESADILSRKCRSNSTTDISKIITDIDLVIVSVSDDALAEVLDKLGKGNSLIVHTSGSVPMDIMSSYSENYGVLYPLQTFSKDRDLIFKEVPLCLEANSSENLEALRKLAYLLTDHIYFIDSFQRKELHLAAVFACNFPNFLYSIAEDFLKKNELPFDLIKPLIVETAHKAIAISPSKTQTGPAFREDKKIINSHLQMLMKHENYGEVYKLLTKSIIDLKKQKKLNDKTNTKK